MRLVFSTPAVELVTTSSPGGGEDCFLPVAVLEGSLQHDPLLNQADLHRKPSRCFDISDDALILDVCDQFICARQQPEQQG